MEWNNVVTSRLSCNSHSYNLENHKFLTLDSTSLQLNWSNHWKDQALWRQSNTPNHSELESVEFYLFSRADSYKPETMEWILLAIILDTQETWHWAETMIQLFIIFILILFTKHYSTYDTNVFSKYYYYCMQSITLICCDTQTATGLFITFSTLESHSRNHNLCWTGQYCLHVFVQFFLELTFSIAIKQLFAIQNPTKYNYIGQNFKKRLW